jgi:hypothetical protein
VLRNPSNHSREFALDVKAAFELPMHAAKAYRAHSPWTADSAQAPLSLHAEQPQLIQLKPFQVLTLEAEPVK